MIYIEKINENMNNLKLHFWYFHHELLSLWLAIVRIQRKCEYNGNMSKEMEEDTMTSALTTVECLKLTRYEKPSATISNVLTNYFFNE